MTSVMLSTPMDFIPLTSLDSNKFAFGTIIISKLFFFASIAMESTPLTGCIFPSRPISPHKHILDSFSQLIIPIADKMATAIGKSKPAPVFLMLAGERFTVMRLIGKE